MDYKIKELNVSDIKPDKNQPRKTFDEEELQHLAESILSNGLLNPIEVDEDYVITDGERRWKAHKIAKIKTITARIVKNKDKTEKLRRQLIFTLQDEEIPTEERYEAIVRLYKLVFIIGPITKEEFAKKESIDYNLVISAFRYSNFVEEEPEIAKKVSPHIIIETASLPKEERKAVLKEFEGTKDKKKDLIREMVKDKRQQIEERKELEELKKKSEIIKKASESEIKIRKTEEAFSMLKDKIDGTTRELQKMMVMISGVRKMKKFYFSKPKEKENFFRFIDGTIIQFERYLKQLKDLKDNIELEVIRE